MSAPVDVLHVLKQTSAGLHSVASNCSPRSELSSPMRERADAVDATLTAVAELLDADNEYDAALANLSALNRQIAEQGWIEVEHDALRNAGTRVVRARIRRERALAACRGDA